MKKILCLTFFCFFLVSCAYQNSEYYKPINTSNKTIGMPASNKNVAYDLKKIFRENGWKILILDTGGVSTTGSTGSNTDLKTKSDFNAAYIVYLNQNRWDTCFPSFTDGLFNYDISIIETSTGEQVFYLEGSDCRSKIEKKLRIQLSQFLN